MNLFKYGQFLGVSMINEDLNKSKKFLKDRFLLTTAAKSLDFVKGELKAQFDHGEIRSLTMKDFTPEQQAELRTKIYGLKLTPDQVRNIERDPDFLKLKELLKDNLGFLYNFVYMFYVEMVSFDEIKSMYERIISYGPLLDKLPKKFDLNFIDPNIDNNSEKLVDGLDLLEDHKKIKKVLDQLPPSLKKDYSEAPIVIKEQLAEIARGFDDVGKGDDGKIDESLRDRIFKGFFGEMRVDTRHTRPDGTPNPSFNKMVYSSSLKRFANIRDFIKAAKFHLKSSGDSGVADTIKRRDTFVERIEECNEKYGALGAEIELNEHGLLVIEVKSFQANQLLNGHTRHCIKDYPSQWDNYIGNQSNKQYYVYNFNLPAFENLFTIGVTIAPYKRGTEASMCNADHSGEIYNSSYNRACHAKDDSNYSSNFKKKLKEWQKEYGIEVDIFDDILKPMTPEEIKKREKAKIAEREIVKKGLTIEQIIQYVKEDGANINKDSCVALEHAVDEDNYEKAKLILELGGNPNLMTKSDAIINKAKNLKMIKLLVSNSADLTGQVFDNICDSTEAVEYCLKQGLNPDFDNSLPIRRCCKGSWKSRDDIGEGYFDVFKLLVNYGAKLIDEGGRNMAVKWAAEYDRIDFLEYMINEKEITSGFTAANAWLHHSRKLTDDKKKKVIAYIEEKIKKYEPAGEKKGK